MYVHVCNATQYPTIETDKQLANGTDKEKTFNVRINHRDNP